MKRFGESEIRWSDHSALTAIDGGNGIPAGTIGVHPDFRVSDYIRVPDHEMLSLRMPVATDSEPSCFGMCFYDENKVLLKNCGVTMGYGKGPDEEPFETEKIYVPREAAYFRTTYWQDGSQEISGAKDSFFYAFEMYSDENRPFTCTLPVCAEMNHVIKRARQLTDIRWEPLVDIPRYCLMEGSYSGQSETHFLDWCKAGCEYTGIPYSGAGEPDRNTKKINPETFCGRWGYYKFHVGIDIDFETFVTAARYPGSIFSERTSQSEPSFDSSPYGTYCSALVGYALGYAQPLPKVIEFCDSPKFLTVNEHLTEVPPEEIRLCDIIKNGAFHIAIITDLIHGENGKVTGIEVSEATTVGNANNTVLYGKYGGFCRRKVWPVESFYSWFRHYALYRVKSFRGISYRKSEFVDVGNESGSMPVRDLPLIPYLGNKAHYKEGHIVNDMILIGAKGFTAVVIEKDGKPFRTLPLEGNSFVHGGFTEKGVYTACLTNGDSRSGSCVWTVE